MDAYHVEEHKLEKHFQDLEILHVLCDSKVAADILAKLGSDRAKVPPGVSVNELSAPSIKQPGAITPELSVPTTQILVVIPVRTQVFINYIKELGSNRVKVPPGVFVEELSVPSIKQPDAMTPELLAQTFKASTGNGFSPRRQQHDDRM
jgi:hypothetical protein